LQTVGEIIARGLYFPEGARWRDGAFWFSDIGARKVHRLVPGGALETVVEVDAQPSGLGWLPDGRLLVVSMIDQKLLRLEGGKLVEHADMSGVAKHWCNDMLVDPRGWAYVSCTGAPAGADAEIVPAPLIAVSPEGRVSVAAPDMMFPNGVAASADNRRLFVAETGANRLTRFDMEADGSLSNPVLHAEIPGAWPDGIAIDAKDELWVADPLGKTIIHLGADGSVVQRVDLGGATPMACTLGGPNGDLLMVCAVEELDFHAIGAKPQGWIEVYKIDARAPGY
jgi:sugar lactone lactonase YvrE